MREQNSLAIFCFLWYYVDNEKRKGFENDSESKKNKQEKGNEILKEKTVTILLNSENKPVKENENCKDYLYVTYKGKNIIKKRSKNSLFRC